MGRTNKKSPHVVIINTSTDSETGFTPNALLNRLRYLFRGHFSESATYHPITPRTPPLSIKELTTTHDEIEPEIFWPNFWESCETKMPKLTFTPLIEQSLANADAFLFVFSRDDLASFLWALKIFHAFQKKCDPSIPLLFLSKNVKNQKTPRVDTAVYNAIKQIPPLGNPLYRNNPLFTQTDRKKFAHNLREALEEKQRRDFGPELKLRPFIRRFNNAEEVAALRLRWAYITLCIKCLKCKNDSPLVDVAGILWDFIIESDLPEKEDKARLGVLCAESISHNIEENRNPEYIYAHRGMEGYTHKDIIGDPSYTPEKREKDIVKLKNLKHGVLYRSKRPHSDWFCSRNYNTTYLYPDRKYQGLGLYILLRISIEAGERREDSTFVFIEENGSVTLHDKNNVGNGDLGKFFKIYPSVDKFIQDVAQPTPYPITQTSKSKKSRANHLQSLPCRQTHADSSSSDPQLSSYPTIRSQ